MDWWVVKFNWFLPKRCFCFDLGNDGFHGWCSIQYHIAGLISLMNRSIVFVVLQVFSIFLMALLILILVVVVPYPIQHSYLTEKFCIPSCSVFVPSYSHFPLGFLGWGHLNLTILGKPSFSLNLGIEDLNTNVNSLLSSTRKKISNYQAKFVLLELLPHR